MNSHISEDFRKCLGNLPKEVREKATKAFKQFEMDPFNKSLQFKQVHPIEPIVSVRVTIQYRAVGVKEGDDILWYWIGHHSEYERIIKNI
jgi:hypothetical protein